MKKIISFSLVLFCSFSLIAQVAENEKGDKDKARKATGNPSVALTGNEFVPEKINPATPVKNQQSTGTCWSFSTTALLESQLLKNSLGNFDLSEMFTVRNIYIEKARNYILRQGNTQFGEGGLGHDVIRTMAKYGAMPEVFYPGYKQGENFYNHFQMVADLKVYLDSILKSRSKMRGTGIGISENWMQGYLKIINENMGVPPADFVYNNKTYNPLSFAKEVLKFNAADYVNITSFTHQPYYLPYVLEVPDNFSSGMYYNIPLKEMMDLVKNGLRNGYTFMWDADVSNPGFQPKAGLGLAVGSDSMRASVTALEVDMPENRWDESIRQRLYENLVTQDDHLMQITGLSKSKGGKPYFVVKNSYGTVGPFNGYVQVSEAYFAINTISLLVPKAAISKMLLEKLKIN
jgi:bleomycin hydrolase